MPPRHPLAPAAARPRIWLFTDERMPGDPVAAARALPPGSGIVLRHYATPHAQRMKLARQLRTIARARGHVVLLAGSAAAAQRIGVDGNHGSMRRRNRRQTCDSVGVHDAVELDAALRAGIATIFISPVFATRSHPEARTLGRRGFARLAGRPVKRRDCTVIALGGMNAPRFHALRNHGAKGWGAIDALVDG